MVKITYGSVFQVIILMLLSKGQLKMKMLIEIRCENETKYLLAERVGEQAGFSRKCLSVRAFQRGSSLCIL